MHCYQLIRLFMYELTVSSILWGDQLEWDHHSEIRLCLVISLRFVEPKGSG